MYDNSDHNPSSTTSHDSFYGTEISLFQNLADKLSGVRSFHFSRHLDKERYKCRTTSKVAYLK